jgi:hypothetical protein
MQKLGAKQGTWTWETRKATQALACLRGHVYSAERLLELADTTERPQYEGYLESCKRLCGLAEESVQAAQGTSLIGRWRIRRVVKRLDAQVVELSTFQLPDTLSCKS